MKKTKLLKGLPVMALAGVMAFGCLGCNAPGVVKNENGSSHEIVSEITNSEYVKLFTSEAVVNEETQTISQNIVATVYPEHAPDKSIDWSASWGTNNEGEGENVSDYLTVRPETDGSNKAIITVYKPFFNSDINVTATTRVGGKTATCNVTYEGIPTTTAIILDETEYKSGDVIDLVTGSTYDITLQSRNILGDSSAKYDEYEIVDMQGVGEFRYFYRWINVENDYEIREPQQTFDFSTASQEVLKSMLDMSFEGKVLKVNVKNDITRFRAYYVYDPTIENVDEQRYVEGFFGAEEIELEDLMHVTKKTKFNAYYFSGYENCFIRLTIKEKITGNLSTLDIKISPTVENVELDNSNIVF